MDSVHQYMCECDTHGKSNCKLTFSQGEYDLMKVEKVYRGIYHNYMRHKDCLSLNNPHVVVMETENCVLVEEL